VVVVTDMSEEVYEEYDAEEGNEFFTEAPIFVLLSRDGRCLGQGRWRGALR
jgi:hypothetical protein